MKIKLGFFLCSLFIGSTHCEIPEELSQSIKNVASSIQNMHVTQQKKSISKTLKLKEQSTNNLQILLTHTVISYNVYENRLEELGQLIDDCLNSENVSHLLQCKSYIEDSKKLNQHRWITGLTILAITEQLDRR
jgi:hypothetical protein